MAIKPNTSNGSRPRRNIALLSKGGRHRVSPKAARRHAYAAIDQGIEEYGADKQQRRRN